MSEMQLQQPATATPPTAPPGRQEREFTVRERRQWQLVLRRFLRHRLAIFSLVVFVIIVLGSYLGAEIWHLKYDDLTSDGGSAPTLVNPFGTDDIGHDQFARVLRGTQQSLKVALIVVLLTVFIGAPWGAVAGYLGGRVDALMMRFVDVLLALPILVVAGALAGGSNGTPVNVALILGLLGWVVMARVVRGVVLSLREQEFIEAARAMGAGTTRIVFRHLLPNAAGVIIVQGTLDIAGAILAEAGLSFLGLGVQPPDTSLGLLVNQGVLVFKDQWWLFYIPGIMIIIIALSVNFIGDGLRDAFDPRQQRTRQ
jgi:ABC-type dipeptide/oligopeptide/nickel transport system permease subunit